MKLIDLLVQELPNRGGWPKGANFIACDMYGQIDSYRNKPEKDVTGLSWRDSEGEGYFTSLFSHRAIDWDCEIIPRDQYEAALAASQQQVWNGGIPPVSTECEIFDCEKWLPVRIRYVGDYLVVAKELDGSLSERVFHIAKHPDKFRPIRTERERKRKDFAKSLCDHLDNLTDWDSPVGKVHALATYDAIAAGKIPGVKVE